MYINRDVLDITDGNVKSVDTEFGLMTIEKIEAGMLNLVTGKIIGTDPILMYDDQCFSRKVRPGSYPVYVYVGKVEGRKSQTVISEVRFAQGRPVKWEMALLKGENAVSFGKDEFMGYEVENGLGCFMDEHVMDMLDVMSEANLEKYEKTIRKRVRESSNSVAEVVMDKKTNANIIIFASGWNDGTFPTYYGLDRDGKILRLVTDFMVIEE